MTICAIAFAVLGRVGVKTFWQRLEGALIIGSIFSPVIELYYFWRFWKREGFDNRNNF
jgi:hypothetical protein